MKFEDAILRSIKAYRKGKQPEELMKAVGEIKYTKDYFDELEKALMESKGKKKKKKPEMEIEDGE